MEKKITGGKINYRKPNVAEKMILLGEVGLSGKDLQELDGKGANESPKMLIMLGKMVLRLEDYVETVDVKIKGQRITEYSKLLEYDECFEELSEIALSLLGGEVEKGKKQESKN